MPVLFERELKAGESHEETETEVSQLARATCGALKVSASIGNSRHCAVMWLSD